MSNVRLKNYSLEIEPGDGEALLKCYYREKVAREHAEDILEAKLFNLYRMNENLLKQYEIVSRRSLEFDYLLKVTKLIESDLSSYQLSKEFLEISTKLLWGEASFCFKCDFTNDHLIPFSLFHSELYSEEVNETELRFIDEDFSFLTIHMDAVKPIKFSNFLKDVKKINEQYSNLNYSYIFPLVIDKDEKYLFWFTFTKVTEFSDETLALVERGVQQLKNIIEKHKAQQQLLENFKKLKEIKGQLVQSEKMASIGTISAGIAHEINNPLSFLLTNTEVLKGYLDNLLTYMQNLEKETTLTESLEKQKKDVEFIVGDTPQLIQESLEGVQRIRDIVQGLRTFSRADVGELKEFNINECLETSLKLVSNELKHKCKVEKELNDVPMVYGSAGQIIQVFTNLLVNSAQAIENYGTIKINSKLKDNEVLISISDTGKGISKSNMNNLFTPFFTTKPTGQGTGLGLSISYGIVKKHKGNIFVESQEGIGTTFHITLPIK